MKLLYPVSSERLMLQTFTESKINTKYLGWLRNPEVNQYLEVRHHRINLTKAKNFVRSHHESESNLFLSVDTIEGIFIGTCTLFFSFEHRVVEIGLMVGDPSFQGKGYASEVIQTLEKLAFEMFDMRKITAGLYASNLKSKRLFERNGFQLEAILYRQVMFNGREEDVLRYCKFPTQKSFD
jgi:[ribosomal protein S5]-alanine N-acetyltransferase